ncbi:GNAT family N-acetyltransferase [bacterium AH-315-K03]|nr:GNAT family N-acetyltransferase [bacterium AH-315-K03]MBN4055230.1 GNAT family N-acetyltransferase [bacterium AH-315-K03]
MKIRQANNADSEAIKRVVFEVLREYGLKPDPDDIDKDLDAIENNYCLSGGYFGVVEKKDEIVASVGIYNRGGNICELRKMYILASQRGKGLGKMLLDFSLDKAREMNFKQMFLETATPLVEAIGLYKKYGFIEYKPENLCHRCDRAFKLYL